MQTSAQNNLDDPEQEIFQKTHRLYLLKTMNGSEKRHRLADNAVELTNFFNLWLDRLSRVILDTGILKNAVTHSKYIIGNSLKGATRLVEEGKFKENIVNALLPLVTINPDEYVLMKGVIYNNLMNNYDLGAKTGLKSMGFETDAFSPLHSKTVDRFKEIANEAQNSVGGGTLWLAADGLKQSLLDSEEPQNIETIVDSIKSGGRKLENFVSKLNSTLMQIGFQTGLFNSYKYSGVRNKRWLQTNKSGRLEHKANEMQGWIGIHKRFESGQLHPGDGSGVFNCQCVLEGDMDSNIIPWDGVSTPEFYHTKRSDRRNI